MYINMVSSANMIHSCLLSFAHNLSPLETPSPVPFADPQFTQIFLDSIASLSLQKAASDRDLSNCLGVVHTSAVILESAEAICLLNGRFLIPRPRITGSGLEKLHITCSSTEFSIHYGWETLFQYIHNHIIIIEW